MVPAVGRSRPTMDFNTVLLPQPLPPITAKMLPRRTSKDRSCWITFGPKASVTPRRASNGPASRRGGSFMPSQPHHVGQDRENRVQCDDADDPDDNRPRRRHPNIGGTAPGLQPDTATCHSDQDSEGDAFDKAEHELIERH